MAIGEALRLMRSVNGLSQKELANELGLSGSYVSELERNNRDPSLSVIQKYSDFFEVPVSSLMLFSENLAKDTGKTTGKKIVSSGLIKLMSLAAKGGN